MRCLAQILAHCEQAISVLIIVVIDRNGSSIHLQNCGKSYMRTYVNDMSLVQSQMGECDMVIYSKKYIFVFVPFSGIDLLRLPPPRCTAWEQEAVCRPC